MHACEYNLKEIEGLEGFSEFLEQASIPIHIVSGDGKVIWANQAELASLGYPEEEYIGHSITDFHADQEVIGDILHRLTHKETLKNYPARLKCKDGSIRHVLINSNVYWKDGEFMHTRCFTRDITPLVEEQQKLEKRNAEVEALNQQMQDFTFLASHDLKEPLRGISNYVSFLMEDYKEVLDEGGIDKLHSLVSLTQKLETRIDMILKYDRISRVERETRSIEPNALITEIISCLDSTLAAENVHIQVQEGLPKVHYNKFYLDEIFYNLIVNALKYNTSECKSVQIGSLKGEGEPIFFVKDNGIGIREQHLENIFKIFKRLHPAKKFGGGSGAGLAIIKKMIEQDGGKIWVESTHGEGSTFFFTLKSEGGIEA